MGWVLKFAIKYSISWLNYFNPIQTWLSSYFYVASAARSSLRPERKSSKRVRFESGQISWENRWYVEPKVKVPSFTIGELADDRDQRFEYLIRAATRNFLGNVQGKKSICSETTNVCLPL